MMMPRRRISLRPGRPVALAAILLLAGGCGQPRPVDEEPLGGPPWKQLVLPIPRTPDTLNPLLGGDLAARVHQFLLQGLTRLDGETGSPAPSLASRWEVEEGGRAYVFHLREDVRWSDGRAFGPEDVVFTLGDLVHAEAFPNPYRRFLVFPGEEGPVYPEVEIWDGGTIRMTIPEPYPPLLRALAHIPILPRHRLREDFLNGQLGVVWRPTDPPSQVVGTGPYALEGVEPGVEVRLRRNPYYREEGFEPGTLPRIDAVVLRVMRKDALQAFLAGEIDILVPTDDEATALRSRAARSASFRLHEPGPTAEGTFITFRHGKQGLHAAFADRRFRQAVSHALDRQAMIDAVFGGRGRPQWSPISPAQPAFHDPGTPSYPHDPKEAARLLDAMGLLDSSGDGVRELSDGKAVSFQVMMLAAPDAPPHARKIAERILVDLSRVGIRVRIRERGPDRILEALLTGEWDAFLHSSPEELDPHLLHGVWMSGGPMHYWSPRQEEPETGWEAEIDRLFRESARAVADGDRRDAYARFQRIAATELPVIYTVQKMPVVAVRGRVRHFAPSPTGLLHNIAHLDLVP